jgi:peroxiredoxin
MELVAAGLARAAAVAPSRRHRAGPKLTEALGLDMDLTARGMGVRSQRYSMLVDNGVVKAVNVEQPGKFEVSDADTMLKGL